MINQENSFLTVSELSSLGLGSFGKNVLISRKASFYDINKIKIGNNVRIDDFCILSGNIKIDSFVHISAYCSLYGAYGIHLMDFSGLSPHTSVFSASDDFSGENLVGPMVGGKYNHLIVGKVSIEKYSQIGANCVVLPGVTVGEGVAVGSMSLVVKSLDPWGIYAGIPVKYLKMRSKNLLNYAKLLLENIE